MDVKQEYVSESDILGPIDYLGDILRIRYRLNGLCLKITVLNTERKYSYYLCQYHYFEVIAWSIMNGTHTWKIKAIHVYQYILG